jgi:hypothetical protein
MTEIPKSKYIEKMTARQETKESPARMTVFGAAVADIGG